MKEQWLGQMDPFLDMNEDKLENRLLPRELTYFWNEVNHLPYENENRNTLGVSLSSCLSGVG